MSEAAGRKRAILALLGGRWPEAGIAANAWPGIAAMAAAHRLEPLLHWRAGGDGWHLPDEIRAAWSAAHRRAALTALAQQAALRLAADRLTAARIPFVALKGVRLAWRDYPAAALRPMRDLDLLVAAGHAERGFAVLQEAGFVAETAEPAAVAEAVRQDRHLPRLDHLGLGATIELHHRLSDPPDRHGYRVPQLDPGAVLARAEPLEIAGSRIPCPAADDLLAHLVTHALYAHRLDCGPLVLADIHFLAADPALDWARFHAAAKDGGWDRGADLLLALTAHWFGPLPAVFDPPPEAVRSAAEDALLADPAGRGHAELFADLAAARSPAAFFAMVARRLAPDRQIVAVEGDGRSRSRFWPGWALRRLARLARRLLDRGALGEARQAVAVLRWLRSRAP